MDINPNDLIVQTYRKSSENGNWLNKPDTCVRIVHVPSGTVVDECEDRSIHRNKANAMKRLEELLNSEQPKTLDDALGEQKATCFAEAFDAMAEAQWEGTYKYPETTYEPLPVSLSQNALIASIFNTLYPEPCALREVHVEALKAIMKLVEKRGGI